MKDSLLAAARKILECDGTTAVFSGAGLSVASGLSTFRDPDPDSLWSRFDPQELASLDGFRANPERVIEWYQWRRQIHANIKPNPAHIALAQQPDLIQITQNVDYLLERAGLDPDNVYHLHGTITRDRCQHDSCEYFEIIDMTNPPGFRHCPQCSGIMRPAVVWFGEGLPQDTWAQAQTLCKQINSLIIVGTSAAVYPASGLISLAKRHGSKIIVINTDKSKASRHADIEIFGEAAIVLPELLDGLRLKSIQTN